MFKKDLNKIKLSKVRDGSLVKILEYKLSNEVEKMLKEIGLLPNSIVKIVKNFRGSTIIEIYSIGNGSSNNNILSTWRIILSSLFTEKIYVSEITNNLITNS